MTDVRERASAVEAELAHLASERRTRKRHGFGKRACVVVIDLQRYFIENDDPAAHAVIEANVALLDRAREKGVIVFLAKVVFDSEDEINPALRARFLEVMHPLFRGGPKADILPRLGPKGGDIVIEKKHASGFAGSILKSEMDRLNIDTVLLTGATTSGCVRATAIEGAALGCRMVLVEEASYDPRPLSGPVALSELADRYADVITLEEALVYLDTL